MPNVIIDPELFYYIGEKPPPLSCRYLNKDNNLIPIAGTLTAKCKIASAAESDISCTSDGSGVFNINWPTGASDSAFTSSGRMRIDVQIFDGLKTWFLPRFSFEIRARE